MYIYQRSALLASFKLFKFGLLVVFFSALLATVSLSNSISALSFVCEDKKTLTSTFAIFSSAVHNTLVCMIIDPG